MSLYAAIDFSGPEAFFSAGLFPAMEILVDSHRDMHGKESSGLLRWIESLLEEKGYLLSEVSRWTVGTGPGNFTGLRVSSALVSGLCFGRNDIQGRGIPSAMALAADLASRENDRIAVIYDGRRGELLYYGVEKKDRKLVSMRQDGGGPLLDSPDRILSRFQYFVAFERDRQTILRLMPEDIVEKMVFIRKFPVARLLFMDLENWEHGSLLDLIYIRSAPAG